MDKTAINERIIKAIYALLSENSGLTKAALAGDLGIKPSKFSEILNYRMKAGSDVMSNLCTKYKISAEWLLTGSGIMTKSESNSDPEIIPISDCGIKQDISEIPLYNVNASAGLDKLFANGGELLGKISVPDMPRCDGAVHVIGDSMYPLLKSGDIIAYKIVNDLRSINYGEIYVLQLDNEGDISVVVKYLKRSEVGDDHIKLVSYNKEHDPRDIPLAWITAIARVTFAIRQFSII